MKLSLILQDDHRRRHHHHQKQETPVHPILKAKLPISIFNQPFTSTFTTTKTKSLSDFSFSLSTNFPSGPSLKLTYAPSAATSAAIVASVFPFSLSLKSGLGLFGSPRDSPLVFAANFSISKTSPNVIVPTFSLQFQPQLGHFSLHRKTISSSSTAGSSSNHDLDPNHGSYAAVGSNLESGSPSNSQLGNGFPTDASLGWQEVKLEPCDVKEGQGFSSPGHGDGVYGDNTGVRFLPEKQLVWREGTKGGGVGGLAVRARTVLPLTKRLKVNLRWGVNLPDESGVKMPYLTVNKIEIERAEGVKEMKEKMSEGNAGDMELLKGMCFWMRRDLEVLEKENRDMKQSIEDMKLGVSARSLYGENSSSKKKMVPVSSDSFGDFEQWRSKRSDGEGSGQREMKKPANRATDLESELQKAIKAASS